MFAPREGPPYSRYLVGFSLLAGIFIFPWYVSAILGILAMVSFDYYIEIVFLALVYEIVYSRVSDPFYTLRVFPYALSIFLIWHFVLRNLIRLTRHE
jgi:hypothetical protein